MRFECREGYGIGVSGGRRMATPMYFLAPRENSSVSSPGQPCSLMQTGKMKAKGAYKDAIAPNVPDKEGILVRVQIGRKGSK